ncbi:MAG: hypothetical protein CL920_22895 [Deltaproteobacteria bacterium]|nr:hypothetical protein [Deltaproteobacteria bacterium]
MKYDDKDSWKRPPSRDELPMASFGALQTGSSSTESFGPEEKVTYSSTTATFIFRFLLPLFMLSMMFTTLSKNPNKKATLFAMLLFVGFSALSVYMSFRYKKIVQAGEYLYIGSGSSQVRVHMRDVIGVERVYDLFIINIPMSYRRNSVGRLELKHSVGGKDRYFFFPKRGILGNITMGATEDGIDRLQHAITHFNIGDNVRKMSAPFFRDGI